MTAFRRFVNDVASVLSDPLIVFPVAGTVLAVGLLVWAACQFAAALEASQ